MLCCDTIANKTRYVFIGIDHCMSFIPPFCLLGSLGFRPAPFNIALKREIVVESTINNLNVDTGMMGVKIDYLNKSVEAIGERVTKLEGTR